ncbi:phage/plasmid-associated DNA primase [Nitrobacteraceae bacterium AZCC 2161]
MLHTTEFDAITKLFEEYVVDSAESIARAPLFERWEEPPPRAEPLPIAPVGFLKALFEHTNNPIYICSFPNDRDDEKQASERHVVTRLPSHITSFAEKWDKPGRGLFFAVGTVKPGAKRNKDNIVETIGLHADIDFKNVDGLPSDTSAARVEVLRLLQRLKHQPTVIVFSGGGLHCYWLFKEAMDTQTNIERIEASLRLLADHVAGDLAVCEVSRVLRLPGSHNTKNGAWAEVEVIRLDGGRWYELDDLEEWLTEASPIMLRKNREHAKTMGESDDGDDFFAEYAKLQGIKPPIDVEARLAAMMYMGGGDSSIHQTQLAVTASLLNSGMPKDEVVAIVLAATRKAAGEYAVRWNWRREERGLHKMCDDWIKKHPPTERKEKPKLERIVGGKVEMRSEPPQEQQQTAGAASNVVPMPSPKATVAKKSEQHITLGQAVLAHMRASGEELINTKNGAWFYSGGIWELCVADQWLNVRIEQACAGLGFKSVSKLINEARQWMLRQPQLWREGALPWDQHGKIPTRSGLIDPLTGELEPARPDHFCTWRIEVDYDRTATCPWWEMMIADFFGDRANDEGDALVRVIQEVLGAGLIDKKPRALSKALVLWGVEKLGKSEIIEVLAGLFGPLAISVPIGSVEQTHGLMPFTRRLPWVLHEAFGGQWHFSSMVKAIITHERVMINVKNGPMISTAIRSPIFWATNFQPQFKEATKAIVSRMIVIECRRAFVEGEPIGTAAEALRRGFAKPSELIVATELQGLLNWAIAGLKRALARGSIELTAGIKATAEAIHRDSNLVVGFLDDCIEYDPLARIKVPDLCAAFSVWYLEQKGEDRRLPSNDSVGKAMSALGDLRIGMDSKEMRGNSSRYYCGIALNTAGLRYHKTAYESRLFEGKIATATNPDREVNSLIPASWDSRKSVIEMRQKQEASKEAAKKAKAAAAP